MVSLEKLTFVSLQANRFRRHLMLHVCTKNYHVKFTFGLNISTYTT